MQPGQLLLRLGWLGTYVQAQHDDMADVVGQGDIPIIHDQDLTITEARLALDVGLTSRFAASLVVPVRVVSTQIVYRNGAGNSVQLVEPSTHHRNETLTGLADPMLLGAYTHVLAGTRLTLRAGMTVPIGRTEEDPFRLGDMGMTHQHIQMGTGTVNPVIAIEATRTWDTWRLGGFAFTQQVFYENGKGYQAGDRYAAGLSLRRAVSSKWSVRGGPEVQAETKERWNGMTYTEEGNQGRFDAMLAAGVAWMATPKLTVDLALKVPVYTHVVGGQLDVPAIAELGVSWTLGGATKPRADEHEHEHGHEHAHDEHGDGEKHAEGEHAEAEHGHDEHGHDEHAGHADKHMSEHRDEVATTDVPVEPQAAPRTDGHDANGDKKSPAPGAQKSAKRPVKKLPPLDTKGVDMVDLGKNGERVALTPVPGKITIFDFWAHWCEPCRTLEPALVEIARANPNVAIRRVEVIDWDSPVVAQHLTRGGFDLPHLKVYDAKGNLVLEQSSAPGKLGALIQAVRNIAPAVKKVAPAQTPAKPLAIDIVVSAKGFEPRDIKVPRGRPVVLRITRKAKNCATEIVFDHEGKRVIKDLPLDKTTELALTFKTPGTVKYACAMDMIGGTITVQ